ILALRRFLRDDALAHVGQHAFGLARERIAIAAASRGIEPKGVSGPQGIIRVARRQALRRRTLRVDPDIAGAPALAVGAAGWGDRMLHRADGEARIGEIEVFAADPEPSAELARAAGIGDQLEAGDAGGKFALDDLDGGDLGIALIDRDAGGAVLARARAGAAGDDLILHIALAGIGVAPAEDDGAAAAAVGAHLARDDVTHGGEDGV